MPNSNSVFGPRIERISLVLMPILGQSGETLTPREYYRKQLPVLVKRKFKGGEENVCWFIAFPQGNSRTFRPNVFGEGWSTLHRGANNGDYCSCRSPPGCIKAKMVVRSSIHATLRIQPLGSDGEGHLVSQDVLIGEESELPSASRPALRNLRASCNVRWP